MIRSRENKLLLAGFTAALVFWPFFVTAADPQPAPPTGGNGNTVGLVNPIGGSDSNPAGQTNLMIIAGGIIKQALGILGSIALLVFVYGGFMWVTAAGNAENVKKGADAMQWAVIGICIIFSSYAIINLIFQGLGVATQKSPAAGEPGVKEGCYCTVNGVPDTSVNDPAYDNEDSCLQVNKVGGEVSKLGDELEECKWYPKQVIK